MPPTTCIGIVSRNFALELFKIKSAMARKALFLLSVIVHKNRPPPLFVILQKYDRFALIGKRQSRLRPDKELKLRNCTFCNFIIEILPLDKKSTEKWQSKVGTALKCLLFFRVDHLKDYFTLSIKSLRETLTPVSYYNLLH